MHRRIPASYSCQGADWNQALSTAITLGGTAITGTAKTCVALDNAAQRQAGPISGWSGSCLTDLSYTLTKSGESKSGTLN